MQQQYYDLNAMIGERARILHNYNSVRNNSTQYGYAQSLLQSLQQLDFTLAQNGIQFDQMGNVINYQQPQQQYMPQQNYQQNNSPYYAQQQSNSSYYNSNNYNNYNNYNRTSVSTGSGINRYGGKYDTHPSAVSNGNSYSNKTIVVPDEIKIPKQKTPIVFESHCKFPFLNDLDIENHLKKYTNGKYGYENNVGKGKIDQDDKLEYEISKEVKSLKEIEKLVYTLNTNYIGLMSLTIEDYQRSDLDKEKEIEDLINKDIKEDKNEGGTYSRLIDNFYRLINIGKNHPFIKKLNHLFTPIINSTLALKVEHKTEIQIDSMIDDLKDLFNTVEPTFEIQNKKTINMMLYSMISILRISQVETKEDNFNLNIQIPIIFLTEKDRDELDLLISHSLYNVEKPEENHVFKGLRIDPYSNYRYWDLFHNAREYVTEKLYKNTNVFDFYLLVYKKDDGHYYYRYMGKYVNDLDVTIVTYVMGLNEFLL